LTKINSLNILTLLLLLFCNSPCHF